MSILRKLALILPALAASAAQAQQINLNVGGPSYTAADGTAWATDQYFSGGDILYSSDSIANTSDLGLYRAARYGLYGDFSYSIPVANGTYNLSLLFAELQYWNRGDRVFHVLVNGAPVLTNFDILAETASRTALVKTFPVTVSTGVLQIAVQGVTRRGILNGIQLAPAAGANPTPPPPLVVTGAPIASINCGGASFTGADGTLWSGDQYFTGGDLVYSGGLVTGSPDLSLYRSARRGLYGNFGYTIPVPNGSYVVKLKFAELLFGAKGQRVFNVNLNGVPALTNFDILADVAPLTVDDKSFPVTVANGQIQIDVLGVVGFGILNGIQVLPAAGAPVAPTLSLSANSLTFGATAGGANPAAQTVNVSTTASWTATSNQPWLTISPAANSFTASAVAGSLSAGSYSAIVTVAAAGAAGSPQTVNVSFSIAPASPTLSVSPTSLAFTATAGGANPAPQTVNLSTTASWTATSNQPWLTISPSANSFTATAAAGSLAAGSYSAIVTIAAAGSPRTVSVSFTVAPASPTLSVSPTALAFAATAGGANPAPQTVNVSTTASWTATSSQPWLTISPAANSFTATASAGSLAAGSYSATVTINAPGATPASRTVAVTLTVAPAPITPPPATQAPIVSINCGGASFTGAAGTAWSADQYFTGGDLLYSGYMIAGASDLALYRSARRGLYGDFSYSIPVPNGSYMLTLRFAETMYGARGQRVFNVNVNGLAALTNFDILNDVPALTADDKQIPVTVTNGALRIDVVGVVGRGLLSGIQVSPAGSGTPPPATLSVSTATLSFATAAGGPNPASQSVAVTTTAAWSATANQPWLTVATAANSIAVGANVAGLATGSYTGLVTIAAPGASGSPVAINVVLTIAPAAAPPPSITSFTATQNALSWITANTTSVAIDQGVGAVAASGSIAVNPAATTTYTLSASNGAATVTRTVTVTVAAPPPAITSFTATQNTLSWVTANATSVAIDQGIGAVAASGSIAVNPAATTTYTLSASNGAATVTRAVTITVSTPPPPASGLGSANTDQWTPNNNSPQSPTGGQVLYNGIQLPAAWPPQNNPSQVSATPPYIRNPPAVIPIDIGRQLFVDDFLIAQTTLGRVQHQPTMYPGNPVLAPATQGLDNNNNAFPFSDGVWYDPADRTFKMWYFGGNGNDICYAYSADGKNWIKPRIADAAVPNTNMVLEIGGGRDSATVWMDLHETNPARKFKAFVYYTPQSTPIIWIYFSPDGIHWTGPQTNTPLSLSDRTTFFYNPFRRVWVESARQKADLPATPTRAGYLSRARFYSESADLLNFNPSNPQLSYWTGPEERDPAYPGSTRPPDLYTLDGTAYESLIVGLFNWYYPGDGPELVELGIGFSRDGFNWVRPTRGAGPNNAFIASTDLPNTWNGYNTQSAGGGFLVVGDQLYFYFSSRNSPHNLESGSTLRQTGLATLRRDGFYSMDAGAARGTLTTRPVRFSGSHLFVNVADAAGALQVEALDSAGNVIPQFAKANSAVISVDKTLQEVAWSSGSIGSLAGQIVQFRFYLTNGSLYSFWVSNSASGASNGYIAAGGPGFTSDVDTVGSAAGASTPPGTAAAPVLTPAGGAFSGSVTVSIASATGGASIRYTTDGSDPTAASPLYTGPFAVNASMTIKAAAFAAGLTNSSITLGLFTVQADTTPPARGSGAPSGALAFGSSQATLSLRTGESAVCKYSTAPNTPFGAMTAGFTTADGIAHSATVTGLTSGSVYTYYVRCQDNNGNANTDDFIITFAVAGSGAFTPFYQYLEAEAGTLAAPMTIAADPLASGGKYVSTATDSAGSVSFTVSAPATGSYYLWAKILSVDAGSDSFYVSVDGGPTDVYDTAENLWSTSWQWTRVNGRGSTGQALTLNPRIFTIAAGPHTITFGGRDPNTKLDQVLVTNDAGFVPVR